MTAWAVILLRFAQYGGGAILFGSSAFLLYSPLLDHTETPRWTKLLLAGAAATLVFAVPLGFFMQTALLAGSFKAALDPAALHAALLEMNFGKSSLARFVMALAGCLVLRLLPFSRGAWWICAALGAGVAASFAWMGHGAATEGALGWVHLAGDIVHSLAAAGWIGALAVLYLALYPPRPVDARRLHTALCAFSGTGTLLVGAIILTGLINNSFLVGWNFRKVAMATYGWVLATKLALFLLMLALAAMNRYRHTPALSRSFIQGSSEAAALRRSIALETMAGFAVLAAVSLLGTLPPVLENT